MKCRGCAKRNADWPSPARREGAWGEGLLARALDGVA
jgi:hypothetical protein